MRNTLYRQMVYWINAHRTWIEVADDNLYKEHIISRSDRTDYLVSRTLVLRAFKTNGTYLEGTTWAIPEHELNKALAIYRKQDRSFKQRIKKASNPQPIGFSGILLAKRQNSFYCTYFLHNRNVADTKSPYPIKRLEVIRWFNQKSMVFNQSLS